MQAYAESLRKKFRRWLRRFLKVHALGVALERDLPPEFIITRHAEERLAQRGSKKYGEFDVLCAWYYGGTPPKGFDPTKCERPPFFKNFIYKHYSNCIYVFGIKKPQGEARVVQKVLVTVLPG